MIQYTQGDATNPHICLGTNLIVHCCNNIGFWGAGFTKALSEKWMLPEIEYRKWYSTYKNTNLRVLPLGGILVVPVTTLPKIYVVNIVGQNGIYHETLNPRPIVYDAIREGLEKIKHTFKYKNDSISIHMPRIGAGLARGKWDVIQAIIENVLSEYSVYVYDLKKD